MKRKKIFLAVALASLSLAGVSTLVSGKVTGLFAGSPVCTHRGNHYLAKDATCVAAGNQEFWACCECETQFLQQPATGVWSEAKELTQTLESTHIAYVAPTGVHDFKPSTSVIGYYECEDCHEVGTQIMGSEDIPAFTIGAYGSNGWLITNATSSATKDKIAIEGSYGFDMNGEGGTKKSIILPKINYSLYKSVSFQLGIDHYRSDSLSCSLDLGGQSLATWAYIKGNNGNNFYQYQLRVYNRGTSLDVEFVNTANDLAASATTINVVNADIMSGAESLKLDPTSATGRTMYIESINLEKFESVAYTTNGLSKGSRSVLDVTKVSETVGGVNGNFMKASLAESTGSYTKVELAYAEKQYSEAVKYLRIRMYIKCDDANETKTSVIFQDYVGTGWSQDNPNWCIKNIDVGHNKWTSIVLPTARLAHDGKLDTVWFYGNGAKAARDYYVEVVELFQENFSYGIVQGKTANYVNANMCAKGPTNLGSTFGSVALSKPTDNHGYEKEAMKATCGTSVTYVLARFALATKVNPGVATSVTLKVYIETAATPSSDTVFILFGDGTATEQGSNQTVTVAAANCNKWIDVTFTNGSKIIGNDSIDHFNFGIWGTSSLAQGDSLIIASITFNY